MEEDSSSFSIRNENNDGEYHYPPLVVKHFEVC